MENNSPSVELTVLMPCLNEAETLATCITKARNWIKNSGIAAEILIADNGSTDGSQEIAKDLGARVVNVPVRGYGAALFHGATAANGSYIIMGDADDSYDFSNLTKFMDNLRKGHDLVMGNRFATKDSIEPGAMPWKNRHIGNPALSFIGRLFFQIPIRDFHCGIRGFSKKSFIDMDLRTTGMEFASEMVIKAKLLGMKISEVPTTLSKDGRSRPPHLRPWADGWRHLRFMLSLSPNWLFVIPGCLLLLSGLTIYAPLLLGPIQFSGFQLSTNSLFLTQALIILGYLCLIFGFATKVVGAREGLIPPDKLTKILIESKTFEIGATLGIGMFLAGLYFVWNSFSVWAGTGFGELEPDVIAAQISATSLLLISGGMTIASSLTFGLLSLPLRRQV